MESIIRFIVADDDLRPIYNKAFEEAGYWDDWRQEAIAEGHAKGKDDGMREGKRDGILQTAINMFKLGADLILLLRLLGFQNKNYKLK